MNESLEKRCRKAIIRMADDVKDINYKLTHLIENSRDYYYRHKERENFYKGY